MDDKDMVPKAPFTELLENVSASLDEPQDYLDLDAGGFLMVALGHLAKAGEKLDQEPPSRAAYRASWDTTYAINFVRRALKVLDKQKEETCGKP